jgi:hypothetical protein
VTTVLVLHLLPISLENGSRCNALLRRQQMHLLGHCALQNARLQGRADIGNRPFLHFGLGLDTEIVSHAPLPRRKEVLLLGISGGLTSTVDVPI